MRVERFFLFFPPKCGASSAGETEYGIGAIPLGGFVKITGHEPGGGGRPSTRTAPVLGEAKTVPALEYPRSYYSQPVWKRIVVIARGPVVNLVIAFVILFVLAFGLGQATNDGRDAWTRARPPRRVLQPGDQLRLGRRRATGDLEDRCATQIATHECAGEQTDGCRPTTPADDRRQRDGKRVARHRDARSTTRAAERPLLGFTYGTRPLDPGGPGGGRGLGARPDVGRSPRRRSAIFGRIFDAEERKQISGVVGSYEVTRQSFEFDTRQALFVLALISLSLAVINLFPFLPLDGGHIFWSLVEKVRGRRVSLRTMERASVVGFVLVLMLFAIGLTNDIGRLTGDGFNVTR